MNEVGENASHIFANRYTIISRTGGPSLTNYRFIQQLQSFSPLRSGIPLGSPVKTCLE